jgi:WD40 repeat protein
VCGGSADGRILIWSFESCELLYNIGTIHTNTIFSVCAAGNVLVSGSNDRSFAVV